MYVCVCVCIWKNNNQMKNATKYIFNGVVPPIMCMRAGPGDARAVNVQEGGSTKHITQQRTHTMIPGFCQHSTQYPQYDVVISIACVKLSITRKDVQVAEGTKSMQQHRFPKMQRPMQNRYRERLIVQLQVQHSG